jgi:hypothetical protein
MALAPPPVTVTPLTPALFFVIRPPRRKTPTVNLASLLVT